MGDAVLADSFTSADVLVQIKLDARPAKNECNGQGICNRDLGQCRCFHGFSAKKKCTKSQKYAEENGLPLPTNVLLPKTRGFYACLEILRGFFAAVYDVRIAYKNQ